MIRPGATVGFVGLGTMGGPMATRLAEAGYQVQGYEAAGTPAALSAAATSLWAEAARALPADADHTEIARWLED